MSSRPRLPPILKPAPVSPSNPFALCPRTLSPHVHFPPTPTISSIHITHSSKAYDRTPLTISPNLCALPGRGERSYNNRDDSSLVESYSSGSTKGSYFHPRAYEVCELETLSTTSSPPPLVYGSSESDESDGAVASPPDPCPLTTPHVAIHVPNLLGGVSHSPIARKCSQEELDNALAFLPHAPEQSLKEKGRTKRSNSSTPSRPTSADRRRLERNSNSCHSFAAPSLDGCLGGF
jgi:hypothetical protein